MRSPDKKSLTSVASASTAERSAAAPRPAATTTPADEQLDDQVHDAQDAQRTREERIRQAAYERYERRGGGAGSPEQDWLDAERDVNGPDPNRVA